jgi:hypothetical protein
LVGVFEHLVEDAARYKVVTGGYPPILVELFAEITCGIKTQKPGTPGSDGPSGNDFIEIKTITPEQKSEQVLVKRKGNFNKLLVVKISENFKFGARMVDRKELGKGEGGK